MRILSIFLCLIAWGCTHRSEPTTSQEEDTWYFQAYDGNWDDPTINPIFENEWEAKDYAHRNNMGSQVSGDDSHSYIVRTINYRYEIRQVNDSTDEILHTTNSKADGVKYVEQYTSAHSDLFMYDLKSGLIITTSTP
jgi:hypothetical protein